MNPAGGKPGDASDRKPNDGPASTPDAAARTPQAFVRRLLKPPAPLGGFRELGLTPLARQLRLPEHQLGGHWCSRCNGIWWGTALEAECPVCGNRNG